MKVLHRPAASPIFPSRLVIFALLTWKKEFNFKCDAVKLNILVGIVVFKSDFFVNQGAQEVFRELPIEYVDPQHLSKVAERGGNYALLTKLIIATTQCCTRRPSVVL